MTDDPRDRPTYKLAITMLGFALAVAIAGVCWVAAEHECVETVPTEIWFIPAAVGGVFVGALIPFSTHRREKLNAHESPLVCDAGAIAAAGALAFAAIGASVTGAVAHHLLALCGVGAALGGVFLGLFIPAPGRRDP